MTDLETAKEHWETMLSIWWQFPTGCITEKYLEDDMHKMQNRYEKAFRKRYNVNYIVSQEELLGLDNGEKVRLLALGYNLLNLSTPYIRSDHTPLKQVIDRRYTRIGPDETVNVIFEGVDWVFYEDEAFKPTYLGLSIKGLMPEFGVEKVEFKPIFVPVDHMQVHKHP